MKPGNLRPGPSVFPVFPSLPVFACMLVAGFAGTMFVARFSSMDGKYAMASFLVLGVAAALLLFHRRLKTISLILFVIAQGIGAKYYLLTQHDPLSQHFEHLEGALAEPVLFLIDFPLALILALAAYRVFFRKVAPPRWTALDTAIIVFLAGSLASLFNAPDKALVVFEIMRYVKYVLGYWALRVLFSDDTHYGTVMAAILCSLGIEALVAVAQYAGGFQLPFFSGGDNGAMTGAFLKTEDLARVTGMIGACNTFGTWLLFPLGFSGAFLISKIKRPNKKAIVGMLALGIVTMALTFSRGGWISLSATGAVLATIAAIQKRFKPSHVTGLVSIIMLCAAAAWLSGVLPLLAARVTGDDYGSFQSRPEMNMVGVRMYLDFPLLGGGLNNFQNLSDKYDKTGVFFNYDVVPHNIFVLIGSETGSIGLLAFIGMGLCILVRAASLLKKAENEYCFILGASGTAVLVGIAIANTVDITLRNDLVLAQCSLIAALIMSAKGPPDASKTKRKFWNE